MKISWQVRGLCLAVLASSSLQLKENSPLAVGDNKRAVFVEEN